MNGDNVYMKVCVIMRNCVLSYQLSEIKLSVVVYIQITSALFFHLFFMIIYIFRPLTYTKLMQFIFNVYLFVKFYVEISMINSLTTGSILINTDIH